MYSVYLFFRKALALLLSALCFLFPFLTEKYDPAPGQALPETPFYGETDKDMLLAFNASYEGFSRDKLCQLFGNEPTYFEWMADKVMWTDDTAYKESLKHKIIHHPQTDNGYLWSWGTSTFWPTGDGDMHYDGLFRYIAAVEEIIRAEGSVAFLTQKDTDTYGSDTAMDASEGRTVYQKCALIMDYVLNTLGGKSGLITITEKSVYLKDGVTRFDRNDEGKLLWNNTGKCGSAASNYWDNFCFGHTDAYESALFYHALDAMAYIEAAIGHTEKAEEYTALMESVHRKFDEAFWDSEKGRYIDCIDADGVKHDYGLTFLNTEALAYGLGDETKYEQIFSWLDGKRIIPTDTIQGDEIRSYTDVLNENLRGTPVKEQHFTALRSSTVAVESIRIDGKFWWNSLNNTIKPLGNAAFAKHLENGGYIFYTFYYELMARARYGKTDDIVRRTGEIADMYRFNGFVSDVGGWAEGLNGEFPENGLVPAAYIKGLLGLSPDTNGFVINPLIPEHSASLGTDSFYYGGNVYDVCVKANNLTVTAKKGTLPGCVTFCPDVTGTYHITVKNAANTPLLNTTVPSGSGRIVVAIPASGVQLTVCP